MSDPLCIDLTADVPERTNSGNVQTAVDVTSSDDALHDGAVHPGASESSMPTAEHRAHRGLVQVLSPATWLHSAAPEADTAMLPGDHATGMAEEDIYPSSAHDADDSDGSPPPDLIADDTSSPDLIGDDTPPPDLMGNDSGHEHTSEAWQGVGALQIDEVDTARVHAPPQSILGSPAPPAKRDPDAKIQLAPNALASSDDHVLEGVPAQDPRDGAIAEAEDAFLQAVDEKVPDAEGREQNAAAIGEDSQLLKKAAPETCSKGAAGRRKEPMALVHRDKPPAASRDGGDSAARTPAARFVFYRPLFTFLSGSHCLLIE